MGFIMDGLEAEAYDRIYSQRALLARILGYFRPRLAMLLAVAGLIVLNSVASIVLPILISRGLDRLAASVTVEGALVLVGAILASGVLGWVANFLRQRYTAQMVGDVVLQLREDAFAAVLKRDMSFYDEYSSGRIVSRVTADTEDFATVVTLTLNLLSQGLLVILIVIVLFTINVRLTLLTLLIAPLILLPAHVKHHQSLGLDHAIRSKPAGLDLEQRTVPLERLARDRRRAAVGHVGFNVGHDLGFRLGVERRQEIGRLAATAGGFEQQPVHVRALISTWVCAVK